VTINPAPTSSDGRSPFLTGRTRLEDMAKEFALAYFIPTSKMSIIALLYLVIPIIAHCATTFEHQCLAFTPEQIVPNATRRTVEHVPKNTTLAFPKNDATCNRAKQVVSSNLCRIALSIQTSSESSIVFEAWLPERWSGRFLATGNGGIDGCE
jgi:hypothetical protein